MKEPCQLGIAYKLAETLAKTYSENGIAVFLYDQLAHQ